MSDAPAFYFDVVHANGSGPTIFLRGEVDMASCEHLRQVIESIVGSHRTVTLDLSDLGFMDSSCLNVIAETHRSLAAGGGRLVLRNPSRMAQTILAVSGLDVLVAAPQTM